MSWRSSLDFKIYVNQSTCPKQLNIKYWATKAYVWHRNLWRISVLIDCYTRDIKWQSCEQRNPIGCCCLLVFSEVNNLSKGQSVGYPAKSEYNLTDKIAISPLALAPIWTWMILFQILVSSGALGQPGPPANPPPPGLFFLWITLPPGAAQGPSIGI